MLTRDGFSGNVDALDANGNHYLTGSSPTPEQAAITGDHLSDWLRFIRDARWSRKQKLQLLKSMTAAEIYQAGEAELRRLLPGRWRSTNEQFRKSRLQRDLEWFDSADKFIIPYGDPHYPDLLAQIQDPPLALFAQGRVELLADPKIAMVGSRQPTPAGSKLCKQLAGGLSRLGIIITSGLALGIDGQSHQAALDAGGGTIAVLGNGVDMVYPLRNRALQQNIAKRGLLLSEFPLGLAPSKATFPQRNRIVSGLALGAIIIEAGENSGTRITARLSMEQNREVMVVPGSPLNAQYRGSHALIKQGAALVCDVNDVLEVLALPLQSRMITKPADVPETHPDNCANSLLAYVDFEPTTLDSIISASGLTAAEVSSMLLMLELEGAVSAADCGGYVRLA